MANYSIIYNNQEIGPMTLDQLRSYNLTPNSMIRVDNGPWVEAYTRPEVMSIINQYQKQYPPYQQQYYGNNGQDKHIIAGVLALIVGGLGVHYFYIGKTTAGILTILLSIFTCGLWGIITLIQGILMLTMSEEEFNRKYVYNSATFPIF